MQTTHADIKKNFKSLLMENCPLSVVFTISDDVRNEILSYLQEHVFVPGSRIVSPWVLSKGFKTEDYPASYCCVQKHGQWTSHFQKAPVIIKEGFTSIIEEASKFMFKSLPKGDFRRKFKVTYRNGKPASCFVNFYKAYSNSYGKIHQDNVIFGAVVYQLTYNSDSGLSLWEESVNLELPIILQQGQACAIFRGIKHAVKWLEKNNNRMTIVLNY
jgi:hypothetical protein